MTASILNTIGLVANMAGVVLLFFFGFPQPNHFESVSVSLNPNTVLQDGTRIGDLEAAASRKKSYYKTMSFAALALLFLGFAAQLIAVWLPGAF